jgi:hypothetical protein
MEKEERGVYTDMEWWTRVRLEVSREGKKKREVLRDEGIGWETLKKILANPEPPGYRLKEPRPKPKIGAYSGPCRTLIRADSGHLFRSIPAGHSD